MDDISQLADLRTYRDEDGRQFSYALIRHPEASGLVVHFSAFYFGRIGNAKVYRETFGGYFHRLRMLGSERSRNWLFLCDQFGADGDGCYYTGPAGDFFVERAVTAIIDNARSEIGVEPHDVVTMGSSMGGTGALKFGLALGARGIAVVCPHIDLDICAERQNRWRHVAYICPDGNPIAETNYPYTRQIRHAIESYQGTLPRLFIQVCEDDAGVYPDQVTPLLDQWRSKNGRVEIDLRPEGGHTSDWATKPLLLDVVRRIYSGEDIPVSAYKTLPLYQGKPTKAPWWWRARHAVGVTRNRVLSIIRNRNKSEVGE